MKATGIIRRIDELGRVVIPKELRKLYKIREGDPLEIFTDNENGLILKKYSPMENIKDTALKFCEALYETTGKTALVADKDIVLAAFGSNKRDYIDKPVSSDLVAVIEERKAFTALSGAGAFPLFINDKFTYYGMSEAPLLADGELFGAIILVCREEKEQVTEADARALRCAAAALAKMI